jgi:flagellin-like hook-associated protein FlgL
MGRIGTQISGIELTLLNRLADANAGAAMSVLRIATMQKINYPSDNPAGFVALSQLQSQMSNVVAATTNVTNAGATITQTQTNLGAVLTQLNTIRTELLKDPSQQAESQEKIDAAITKIEQLSTATINGRRLLDGSADYQISGQNRAQVSGVTVSSTGAGGRTISGSVTQAATQGSLTYTGSGGTTTSAAQFTLTGDQGSASISVDNGETLTSVATKINNQSNNTGVSATVDGDQLALSSVRYGSAASVTVEVDSGTFIVAEGSSVTDSGTDVQAEINGRTYTGTSTAQGNQVTVNENGLHFDISFTPGFTGTFDSMTIGSGGLTFAVSSDPSQLTQLAIPSVQPAQLGGLSGKLNQIASGGPYSGLGDNTARALRIVNEAIGQVTRVQGSVDGFYNASITSASSLLADLQVNLQDSIDSIDLVDVAKEQSLLSHYQTLAANAEAGLAIMNDQQSSIVALIKHIAGLD